MLLKSYEARLGYPYKKHLKTASKMLLQHTVGKNYNYNKNNYNYHKNYPYELLKPNLFSKFSFNLRYSQIFQ